MNIERFYTVREAAEKLRMKEATLRQLMNQKEIIAYKVGKRWLLKEVDLHLFSEGSPNIYN